jgi:hypothetical protein
VNRLIVPAYNRLRPVAPEMARRYMFTFFLRESFLQCRANIQAFCPQMLAKWLVHGVNLSV